MKIALAALGFIDNDIYYNKKVIINALEKFSNVDIIVFGESFLQGFDSLKFNYNEDIKIAVSIDSDTIDEIKCACKQYNIAVSFGFFENFEKNIYSSQITIGSKGNIINIYRRVSIGWKEAYATEEYKEGKSFNVFNFMNKRITIGLCGDLWYDENIDSINELNPDIVLWPEYTDYNYDEWNKKNKYEYLEQANRINAKVLLVNSYCINKNDIDSARGGALYISNKEIVDEALSGKENILIVEA
jgi:N-carbamoylputrescine amidase